MTLHQFPGPTRCKVCREPTTDLYKTSTGAVCLSCVTCGLCGDHGAVIVGTTRLCVGCFEFSQLHPIGAW